MGNVIKIATISLLLATTAAFAEDTDVSNEQLDSYIDTLPATDALVNGDQSNVLGGTIVNGQTNNYAAEETFQHTTHVETINTNSANSITQNNTNLNTNVNTNVNTSTVTTDNINHNTNVNNSAVISNNTNNNHSVIDQTTNNVNENTNTNTNVSASAVISHNTNVNTSNVTTESKSTVTTDNTNKNTSTVTTDNTNNNTNTNRNYNETTHTQKIETNQAAPATVTNLTTSGQDTCFGSVTGGVSVAGASLSSGKTYVDQNCIALKQAKLLTSIGLKDAAILLLANYDEDIADAIRVAYPTLADHLDLN